MNGHGGAAAPRPSVPGRTWAVLQRGRERDRESPTLLPIGCPLTESLGHRAKSGGAPGTRTRNQRLKRPLLYH